MSPIGLLGKDRPKSKVFILFKCQFQIVFLLLLNAACFQAMYSSAVFRLVAEGGRLDGHVISEQRTYNVIECAHLCLLQFPSCKSINYETRGIPLNQGNKCQLNNATKISRPDQLLKANTFDYSEPVKELENATSPKQAYAKTCDYLYKSGATTSGVYTIDPDGLGSFDVKCDMSTDNGGWTVFQRREDGSVDFNLDWTQYKNGFGDLNGEFWLGLDKIHRLSAIGLDTLRIDLESFANEKRYAIYSQFMVASKVEEYKLTAQSFTGNALDSLAMQNGMKFTTKDNDNDQRNWENCAAHYKGGWWFNNCHESNLNGLYHIGQYLPGDGDGDGVVWVRWKGFQESLKTTEMKVRPSSQT